MEISEYIYRFGAADYYVIVAYLLMLVSTGLPLTIPFVLMYWAKKTPRWSAVVSIILGSGYSYLSMRQGWSLVVRVFGILVVGTVSFFLSGLFWKHTDEHIKIGIASFYEAMNHPIDLSREGVVSEDVLVGRIIAGGLLVVMFFPKTLES